MDWEVAVFFQLLEVFFSIWFEYQSRALQLCALNSYVQHLQEGFEAAVLGVGMTEARKVSLAQDKSIEDEAGPSLRNFSDRQVVVAVHR
jgi:hypothetical protein